MSSDPLKKRKSKVLRGEGAVPEIKRGRVEGDQQVSTYGRLKPDLLDQLSSGWRYSKLIKSTVGTCYSQMQWKRKTTILVKISVVGRSGASDQMSASTNLDPEMFQTNITWQWQRL